MTPSQGCRITKPGVVQSFLANGSGSDKSLLDPSKRGCKNKARSRLLWISQLLDQDH